MKTVGSTSLKKKKKDEVVLSMPRRHRKGVEV